ncbi:aldo-keto reductase Mvan_2161-like [Engraulis encrasicolus]|uniref:aldo-keto reductase Mvan_2161-like n=1 Tax=Engraulis encrasicolus TaxID=184585 RepID=UPI002FD365E8
MPEENSGPSACHLAELLRTCRTPPDVLQVELHPMWSYCKLRRVCAESDVYFQAFSSLGQGALVQKPEVVAVAEACRRTPAQVLLRWALQQGVGVLPSSRDITRVQENGCVFDFELSLQHVQRLSALDCGRRVCRRDPSCVT